MLLLCILPLMTGRRLQERLHRLALKCRFCSRPVQRHGPVDLDSTPDGSLPLCISGKQEAPYLERWANTLGRHYRTSVVTVLIIIHPFCSLNV